MNRIITLAILSTCSGLAFGQGPNFVPGTYHLKISDQARTVARTMGEPMPEGSLLLGRDHAFEMVYRTGTESSRRFGTYFVDGPNIALRFRNRDHQVFGTVQAGSVLINGLEYRRDGWTPPAPVAVFSPDPHPPVVYVAVPTLAPAIPSFDPIGTWSVRNHGLEDISSKIIFDRSGNFSFSGHGAKSCGHYQLHDSCITLVWTKIDDDAVEEGTVKKDVPICANRCGFDIDSYHYERCTQ